MTEGMKGTMNGGLDLSISNMFISSGIVRLTSRPSRSTVTSRASDTAR